MGGNSHLLPRRLQTFQSEDGVDALDANAVSGSQGADVVYLRVQHELVKYVLSSGVGERCGGFEGGIQRKWLQGLALAVEKNTRNLENVDEPRSHLTSSDDLNVCTACPSFPTTARRLGPLGGPGLWSCAQTGIRRHPGW